jgi:Restriction endonuclease S subunits
MSEWKEVKLKTVCSDISYGYTASASKEKVGPKFLRITDITSGKINWDTVPYCKISEKDYHKYKLSVGDIVIARTGTLGSSAIIKNDIDAVFASYLIRFRIDEKLADPFFISYVLQSQDFKEYVNAVNSGSVQPGTNARQLGDYEFPLPPLPEQKAIAEVLSSIDDKIELLHRQNKTLEEMAMTLFRQWFIEPTKDGLPDGWEERKLKDIYIFEKGIEPGSKNYLETPSIDTIRFIRVGDMLDNKADVYIKKDLAGNSICKFDDLLVSFDGTVGRVSFGLVGCYSSGIRKVYSKDEVYNKLWLKHQIFISEEIQDEINMHAEGTTILHASSSIDYLSFVFPPKEKIEEYDKFFDPIYKKILNNKTQIQTLEKLRDTLLPKLMSGEVKII